MKPTKTDVVIDKSFLQGASKDSLQSLFQNHRILMAFVNFYEILTTSASERALCFKRFPKGENPVRLVESVDLIRQWEIENRLPLLNIDHVIRKEPFHFNSELVNEKFKIGEEQTRYLEICKKEVKTRTREFAEHCSKIPIRFPELRNYRPGTRTLEIEKIQERVCNDSDFVRGFFSTLPGHTGPPGEHIDEQWALFKWMQIRLMAALDYFRKYGEREMSSETSKIENEYLDLEYCLIGCLVGSIATLDNGMAKRFQALCPSGKIIS